MTARTDEQRRAQVTAQRTGAPAVGAEPEERRLARLADGLPWRIEQLADDCDAAGFIGTASDLREHAAFIRCRTETP